MSKSALGRGLGELMDAKQAPAAQVASGAKIYVSPGVKTILHGGKEAPKPEPPATPQLDYWPMVRTLLVATDLLLLFLCALLVWRAAGAMTVWEALACTLAVTIGAALACASVLISHPTAASGRGSAERA